MPEAHAPRPADLVALVTFDGEVRENLAVTREHLGEEPPAPRPLSAAIEQWLHLGRRTWVSVEGREVRGIATARELGDASAWEIDALIDASDEHPDGEAPVLVDLLSRAGRAAADAEVTRVLFRTPSTVAASAAIRAGFRTAAVQRLWGCHHLEPGAGSEGIDIRDASEADEHGVFQLYSRAVSADTRATMAMTLAEWQSLRSGRWLGRHHVELIAEREGAPVGYLRCARHSGQVDLLVDPDHAQAAGEALLDAALPLIDADRVFTLTDSGSPLERTLERRGMRMQQEFTLLSRRTTRTLREPAAVPANARLA